jgi:hypothetical protein
MQHPLNTMTTSWDHRQGGPTPCHLRADHRCGSFDRVGAANTLGLRAGNGARSAGGCYGAPDRIRARGCHKYPDSDRGSRRRAACRGGRLIQWTGRSSTRLPSRKMRSLSPLARHQGASRAARHEQGPQRPDDRRGWLVARRAEAVGHRLHGHEPAAQEWQELEEHREDWSFRFFGVISANQISCWVGFRRLFDQIRAARRAGTTAGAIRF